MHCGDPSLKTLGYVCSILGHVTNEKLVSFQEKSSALFAILGTGLDACMLFISESKKLFLNLE